MNIHEFQAKQILRRFGAPVPKGQPATAADEMAAAFNALGQPKAVAKVQIHAGGRGKAGGVKLVTSAAEAREFAERLLNKPLVTHQTGRRAGWCASSISKRPAKSRASFTWRCWSTARPRAVAVIASTEGGMEIEEVAAKTPEKIITEPIDPVIGVAALPGAQDRFRAGAQGQAGQPVRRAAQRAVSRV